MATEIFRIARCPVHGLHGGRTACFECGGPVEQVAMVDASRLAEASDRLEVVGPVLANLLDELKAVVSLARAGTITHDRALELVVDLVDRDDKASRRGYGLETCGSEAGRAVGSEVERDLADAIQRRSVSTPTAHSTTEAEDKGAS